MVDAEPTCENAAEQGVASEDRKPAFLKRLDKGLDLAAKLPDLPLPGRSDRAREGARNEERSKEPSTMLTYVREAFDSFAERPLGEVDSIVFAWLSYYRLNAALKRAATWEGIALSELLRAEDFEQMFGTSWDPEASRDLLFAVCASPRFRAARLCGWRYKTNAEEEEQFAAMTFRLPTGATYVAFRGTDSTIVGWKEDLNMAYLCPVPSQVEAAAYLEEALRALDGPVYVGGHSKGGNLAVYAAAQCPVALQGRIVRVFSHDGPGFDDAFLASSGFLALQGRICKTIPKSSVIGLIMDDGSQAEVVESDGVSVFQHNPFLWEVEGNAFKRADGLTASARYLATTIASWMARFTPEERGRFIDTLFGVIGVTGANRFADIKDSWKTSFPAMREAAGELDPEERDIVLDVIKALAKTATIDKVSDAATSLIASINPLRDDGADGVGGEDGEAGVPGSTSAEDVPSSAGELVSKPSPDAQP